MAVRSLTAINKCCLCSCIYVKDSLVCDLQEDAEATRLKEERLAAYAAKKAKSMLQPIKTSVCF